MLYLSFTILPYRTCEGGGGGGASEERGAAAGEERQRGEEREERVGIEGRLVKGRARKRNMVLG